MADLGPSEWLVNKWLADTFNGVLFGGLFLQLHTGLPGPAGTANVLADTDRQPVSFGAPVNGFVQSVGAPPEFNIVNDGTVTHGSLWSGLEGGTWIWNLIATKQIPVVEGDLLIVSDQVTFQLEGWV